MKKRDNSGASRPAQSYNSQFSDADKAAEQSFQIWCMVLRAEVDDPSLKHNPIFIKLRADVYDAMQDAFEASL